MNRNSLFAVVTLAALTPFAAQAQGQFDENTRHAGFHLGVSGVGSTASIGAQGDVAINDQFSVGGWFDTWSYGQSFGVLGSTVSWDIRYIAFAGTGSFHFPIEDQPNLDLFAGGSLGFFVVQATTTGTTGVFTGDGNRLFFGAHGGARYWFKENMAALAQIGVGASYLTLGMDFGF